MLIDPQYHNYIYIWSNETENRSDMSKSIIGPMMINRLYYLFRFPKQSNFMLLTGNTFGLDEIRSALVTCLVWSSVHFTSIVNSTEHSGQNSSHVQS